MNLRILRMVATGLAVMALSACSMFMPPDTNRLLFGLLPTNELGYEVDNTGQLTISARTLQLSTRPGMPTTTVTGYRVAYYDDDGDQLEETEEVQTLNIIVPAGFTCTTPDPVLGCNAMSPGARPAPGMPATVAGAQDQFLNASIVLQHIDAGMPVGWYAAITLYYDNAYGSFEETYRAYIVSPN